MISFIPDTKPEPVHNMKPEKQREDPSWKMHDILGVPRAETLLRVGHVPHEDLRDLQAQDLRERPHLGTGGWPSTIDEADRALARQYGFDAEAVVETDPDRPFVSFGTPEQKDVFRTVFTALAPNLAKTRSDIQSFSAFFAHLHTDDNELCRAQIMLIMSNPVGHMLYSAPGGRDPICLVPCAGDLVLLDNHAPHAVLPHKGLDIEMVRNTPMTGVFLVIEDSMSDLI